jgi:hypothetical protein
MHMAVALRGRKHQTTHEQKHEALQERTRGFHWSK